MPSLEKIVCESVQCRGYTLKFKPPLELYPYLDRDGIFVSIYDKNLGIDVCGYTVGDLLHELCDELEMLWDRYACANDADLAYAAKVIKYNLLERIEKVR